MIESSITSLLTLDVEAREIGWHEEMEEDYQPRGYSREASVNYYPLVDDDDYSYTGPEEESVWDIKQRVAPASGIMTPAQAAPPMKLTQTGSHYQRRDQKEQAGSELESRLNKENVHYESGLAGM